MLSQFPRLFDGKLKHYPHKNVHLHLKPDAKPYQFGLYKYLRLPMGILESPDIAQEIMDHCLRGLNLEVYMDDICIFSDTWEEHLEQINACLHRLQDNGFTMNPLKCEWAVQETDWQIGRAHV